MMHSLKRKRKPAKQVELSSDSNEDEKNTVFADESSCKESEMNGMCFTQLIDVQNVIHNLSELKRGKY